LWEVLSQVGGNVADLRLKMLRDRTRACWEH
jgi:hypothetical protein